MGDLLILLRHGESEHNVANRTARVFCGQFDSPLTLLGRAQASAAAEQLSQNADLPIGRAVSSSLVRARETLDIVLARYGESVCRLPHDSNLNERSLGLFENRDEESVFSEFPQYRDDIRYRHFQNHFEQKAPQGENLTDVTIRAWGALQRLIAESSGSLLVVSHGVAIRCILGKALGLTNEKVIEMKIPNAVPIVLRRQGADFYELHGDSIGF